jgi:hypothetical protein
VLASVKNILYRYRVEPTTGLDNTSFTLQVTCKYFVNEWKSVKKCRCKDSLSFSGVLSPSTGLEGSS